MKTIHTLTGDGAFGLTHDLCITPFFKETAEGVLEFKEHDWSLNNRVVTDGAIIQQSLNEIIKEGAAAVKYPGATATDEELAYAVSRSAQKQMPKTPLGKGKSPNAAVRGASGLDASIVRPPAKSALLIEPIQTQWKPNTDVTIETLSEGRKRNATVVLATIAGDVSATFTGADGASQTLQGASKTDFKLAAGSPVTVTHVQMDKAEALIRGIFDKALREKADVKFTNKNTVLTSIDAPILKKAKELFSEQYKTEFEAAGLKFSDGLVDDAFAYLMANDWKHPKKLIMLCPDDCYGEQMQRVLAGVKKAGLNYDHTKHQVAVARLSNGYGDEYGGIHFHPPQDGTLIIKDASGKETKFPVVKDSMWLISSHDAGAAKTYANRMIDYALKNSIGGQKIGKLYFGFDAKSPSEGPLVAAIQEVLNARKNELTGITAEIRDPAEIAAEVLTHPNEASGTLLALNNLWGDIIADLFPALANNKASYDSLLISDKGFMVETGAGGTAGGLLEPMLAHGKLPLNPIAILSGYAHSIRYKADAQAERYADHLEEAIDQALKQGYLTGDLVVNGKPQLRKEFTNAGATPKAVDTRVFVQAVKANMLALQGKTQAAEAAAKELKSMETHHDFAKPAAADAQTVSFIHRYLTLPSKTAAAA